jgi:hypothetical protein
LKTSTEIADEIEAYANQLLAVVKILRGDKEK